jgi:hypothetical protein
LKGRGFSRADATAKKPMGLQALREPAPRRLDSLLKKVVGAGSGAEARVKTNDYRSGKPLRHPKTEFFNKLLNRSKKRSLNAAVNRCATQTIRRLF